MSGIAFAGSLTLLMKPETLDRLLLPMVALAAGSLIGGAFFHMLPVALSRMGDARLVFLWVSLGLLAFMALEQFFSGSTFLVGGLFTYYMSTRLNIDTDALIAFGAGNFIYIGASELIPRINRESSLGNSLVHFGSFALGLAWLYLI